MKSGNINQKSRFARSALIAATLLFTAIPLHSAVAANLNPNLPGGRWDSIKTLPDWSGMWQPGKPPANAPVADQAGAQGSIFGFGTPLKPQYAAARDKRMLAVKGQGPDGLKGVPLSNSGLCIPSGEPLVMIEVSHEYLFTPGRVTLMLENGESRKIWTDGRGHPSDDDSNPSFSGHSIGHWEGDTLVVDTIQIFPDAEFYLGGHVTDQTHLIERFTRVGDKMRVRTTMIDPVLFTKPWVFTRWFDRQDREPVDYDRCTLEDRVQKGDGRLLGIDFSADHNTAGDQK